MTKPLRVPPQRTFADLLRQLGDISPDRVLMQPTPGTATVRDLASLLQRTDRLYELVDGVIVEKVMALHESILAAFLIGVLSPFVRQHQLGLVAGSDGPWQLFTGLVRMPDVAFISWDRLPNRRLPDREIPGLVPDLAIEVLSKSNRRREMLRKLKEYFLAGVVLVWFVNPRKKNVQVYTAPDQMTELTEEDALDGGSVLPGFRLSIREIFASTPTEPNEPRPNGKKRKR